MIKNMEGIDLKKSKMFDFVDAMWNPIRVRSCPYDCYRRKDGKPGCWAQMLRETRLKQCYNEFFHSVQESAPELKVTETTPIFIPSHPNFSKFKMVFVGTMCDIFAPCVADGLIEMILQIVRQYPGTDFLFLTKNPWRYVNLLSKHGPDFFPKNVVYGCTIESNRNYPELSKAPAQKERFRPMLLLQELGGRVLISIEPILEFDFYTFVHLLEKIKPWKVAVGFDNYGCGLPEPSKEKTLRLIQHIEVFASVCRKNLRDSKDKKDRGEVD